MCARLTKTSAAQGNIPDLEFSVHEMVQRHTLGHYVTAGLIRFYLDLIVALQSFNRLDLDERHITAGSGLVGVSAQFVKVAISLEPSADHCLRARYRFHRRRSGRRDME